MHDYGDWDLVATRNNHNLARLIYPQVKPGDTLVGFSNGAAIIAQLQALGVETPKIVLIQPALDNKWKPNSYTQRVTVFWNDGDLATVAGKYWRLATTVFPWNWDKGRRHEWGEMGHTGYVGKDERYVQFRTDDGSVPDLPRVSGHGSWAKDKNRAWREFIVDRM